MEGKTLRLKVVIYVDVTSAEYDSVDSIIDELSSESLYSIPSADCVEVVRTEWGHCEEVN